MGSRTFKLSKEPAFIDKLRNIVRRYMSPIAHSLVLSFDEKSPNRTRPLTRRQRGCR
jgi:hypothetical protein